MKERKERKDNRISKLRSTGQCGRTNILTCRICVPWCCSNKSNAKPAAVLLDEAPGKRRREDADQKDNSIKTEWKECFGHRALD